MARTPNAPKTLKELQSLSDEDIVTLYDAQAERLNPSLNFYREEILRRSQERSTRATMILTVVALLVSIVSTIIAVLALYMQYRGRG